MSDKLQFVARLRNGRLLSKHDKLKFVGQHRRWPLLLRVTIVSLALALISLSAFFINSYRSYAKIVDARLAHGYLTSRAGIYAAPRTLRARQKLSAAGLAAALRRAGYVESDEASEVRNGSYSVADTSLEIRPNNTGGYPAVVRVTFDPLGRIV